MKKMVLILVISAFTGPAFAAGKMEDGKECNKAASDVDFNAKTAASPNVQTAHADTYNVKDILSGKNKGAQ